MIKTPKSILKTWGVSGRVFGSALGAMAIAGLPAISPSPVNGQSPQDGQAAFQKRCAGCHALDADHEGPRLRGVVGRAAGTIKTFQYSDALKNAKHVWDEANLDKWLTDPESM